MKFDYVYKKVMSGVSMAFPLLVATTLIQSFVAFLLRHDFINLQLSNQISAIASYALFIVVPLTAGGITNSISGKAGLMPGIMIGIVSNITGASLFGAIIYSFILGHIINMFLKIKLSVEIQRIVPTIIFPLLFGIIAPLIYYFLFTGFFAYINQHIVMLFRTDIVVLRFILGALFGFLMVFDLGGRINKTTSMVLNALFLLGIYEAPILKMVGGMIAPMFYGLIQISKKEKSVLLLGSFFITESLIPYYEKDKKRIMLSAIVGTTLATGLAFAYNIESLAIQGGIFSLWMVEKWKPLVLVFAVGILTSILVYVLYSRLKEKNYRN